jgi:hypothetical protein
MLIFGYHIKSEKYNQDKNAHKVTFQNGRFTYVNHLKLLVYFDVF